MPVRNCHDYNRRVFAQPFLRTSIVAFGPFQVAAAGFLTLTPDAFAQYFAQDLPPSQTSVMAAAQAPALSRCFDETVTEAAWKNKPSWFVVADQVG